MKQNQSPPLHELLNTIQELVKIKTTKGSFEKFNEAKCYVKDFFGGSNINIAEHNFNGIPAMFISTRGNKKPHILLQGHLDVVNGFDEQFIPKIKNNKLFGRGTVDMKGFIALSMHLIRDLAEMQNVDVGLMITFDEEIDSENGTKKLAEMGYSTDLLINGDGGYNNAVIYGEKGILKFKMIVESEPGRHPYPWKGENAFDLLIRDYRKITSLFPNSKLATDDDNWHTTYSIYDVGIKNKELHPPHYAEAKMNIYFVDNLSVHDLQIKIEVNLKNVKLERISGSERVFIDPSSKEILQMQSIMNKHFNPDIVLRTENGSSDARFYANKGIPIVIVKMVGEDHHGENEHIDIPSIIPMYNSLKEFVLQNCNSIDEKEKSVLINEIAS